MEERSFGSSKEPHIYKEPSHDSMSSRKESFSIQIEEKSITSSGKRYRDVSIGMSHIALSESENEHSQSLKM